MYSESQINDFIIQTIIKANLWFTSSNKPTVIGNNVTIQNVTIAIITGYKKQPNIRKRLNPRSFL